MTAWSKLYELRDRTTRTWLGLMSGTSCDGIDAAKVVLEEQQGSPSVRQVSGRVFPFSEGFSSDLREALSDGMSVEAATAWDARLGAEFATVAAAFCAEHADIDAIALSGHTFSHLPHRTPSATLQLGNPACVAEACARPVVGGFRASDVARGGEGAPLVPVGDRVLFGDPERDVVVINLGGIANLTWLPRGGQPRAADSGPCNLVLNSTMRLLSGGSASIDRDGECALGGVADRDRVDDWLQDPFFLGEWRSTGREQFGEAWVDEHSPELLGLGMANAMATLVEWIAHSIALCLDRIAEGARPDRVLLAGGGCHNRALSEAIAARFLVPVSIVSSDVHGVSADLREAAAFAILGNEWLMGRPGSYPTTTGCQRSGPLGALWLP